MITERRQTRRFHGRIGIVASDDEGLNFSFILDLSRDGAYVETERLLPVGAKFDFVLSNRVKNAQVTSEVVRNRDAFFHGGKSGFGVRFKNLDGTAKALRDDLLLFFMNERYQQMWEQEGEAA